MRSQSSFAAWLAHCQLKGFAEQLLHLPHIYWALHVNFQVTQSHGVRKKNPKKKKGEMKFRFDQNGHLIRSGFAGEYYFTMKELTHLGLWPHMCVFKNNSHFLSNAYSIYSPGGNLRNSPRPRWVNSLWPNDNINLSKNWLRWWLVA